MHAIKGDVIWQQRADTTLYSICRLQTYSRFYFSFFVFLFTSFINLYNFWFEVNTIYIYTIYYSCWFMLLLSLIVFLLMNKANTHRKYSNRVTFSLIIYWYSIYWIAILRWDLWRCFFFFCYCFSNEVMWSLCYCEYSGMKFVLFLFKTFLNFLQINYVWKT